MADPYETLGVQRMDDAATIRAAYRKLAKQHHPDVNPGKPDAADRFRAIAAAYDLLGDADKRARFDRGEIDADGQERPPPRDFYRGHAEGAGAGRYAGETTIDPEDLEALFGRFGFGGAGVRGGGPRRGADARYGLTVSFVDAAAGTTRRITLPDGRTLDVTIPPGLADGAVLRLRGQGDPGIGDAPAGDALVEVAVAPHRFFRREGDAIVLRLPVTLKEAVLGASVEVPTITGPVRLAIPPGSGTGTRLRLRGRGIRGDHQFVDLDVVLPQGEDPALADALRGWTPRHDFNPRAELEGA